MRGKKRKSNKTKQNSDVEFFHYSTLWWLQLWKFKMFLEILMANLIEISNPIYKRQKRTSDVESILKFT